MHNKYQNFIRDLIEPFYKHIGSDVIDNEHKFRRYSRLLAYNIACNFGYESCLNDTKTRLKDEQIHPDLMEVVFANGLKTADEDLYEAAIQKMLSSRNQAERTLLIRALASTQDEDLLESLLELAVSNEARLRLQEKYRIFRSIPNAGAVGAKVAIEFIQDEYEKLSAISPTLIKTIINSIAPLISSTEPTKQFNQLLDFLLTKSLIDETYKSSVLKTVDSTKKWQDKYSKTIEEWLDDQANKSSRAGFISLLVLTFSFAIKIFL